MSKKTFSVVPVAGGWAVEAATVEPLVFLSGGRAEAKAKELAELSGKLGAPAEVRIHDRNGTLIGQRAFSAPDEAD